MYDGITYACSDGAGRQDGSGEISASLVSATGSPPSWAAGLSLRASTWICSCVTWISAVDGAGSVESDSGSGEACVSGMDEGGSAEASGGTASVSGIAKEDAAGVGCGAAWLSTGEGGSTDSASGAESVGSRLGKRCGIR